MSFKRLTKCCKWRGRPDVSRICCLHLTHVHESCCPFFSQDLFFPVGLFLSGTVSVVIYLLAIMSVLQLLFLFYTAYVLYYGERSGVDLMGLKPNP